MSGDDQEKTEEPTDRKLEDAREKGDVATSAEMRHAVMFGAAFIASGWLGTTLLTRMMSLSAQMWGGADRYRFDTPEKAQSGATSVLLAIAGDMWPLFLLLVTAPVIIWLAQGNPTFATARLKIQWSKLSPLSGLKKLFGTRALIEFAKTLVKAIAVGLIAWLVIWPRMTGLDQLIGANPASIGEFTGELVRDLLRVMAIAVVALAAGDFWYQRQSFLKRMRMSLQEIKDELKQNDGDPMLKARIRALRMARAKQRMMAAVPQATVVITNPTHYSVALRYEHGVTAAPVVVAKGVDAAAFRIRERASGAGVPIIEAPPLARALYAAVKIDHPIPVEHYTAVAEIIGQVLKLNRAAGAGASR